MPRLTYFTGLALLLVVGAFLLTDGLLKPPPKLEARCKKMLAMQFRVHDRIRALARAIEANADKEPSRAHAQEALALAEQQQEIIEEATRAMHWLAAEGSAVAIQEVFIELRKDMKEVQCRLASADAGKVTQAIELDIIDTLQEMIKALEKPALRHSVAG